MLHFENDYGEGAHPEILRRLAETNLVSQTGYGDDAYSVSAREKIRKAVGHPEADVYFISGGTQTNQLVISSMLRPYEGVVSAVTGHVNAHEAGAIESTGHKVLALPGKDGKLQAETLRAFLEAFYADDAHDHMVFPGMVYISYPTEYGTLYSKAELSALHGICKKYGMPLFVDGARLGYGLMSPGADLTLPELADLCDVFYIGGTKVGALLGEAVVFPKGDAPAHFFTMIKQRGALLAKGRVLGLQFDALFTDDLYFRISGDAVRQAGKLKKMLLEKGYELFLDSPTNQQFVVLPDEKAAELKEKVVYSFWEKPDENHTVVRFATSWATTDEKLEALRALL